MRTAKRTVGGANTKWRMQCWNGSKTLRLAAVLVAGSSGAALAFDVKAGPIWNNDDAKNKCPPICSGLRWNGQWTTTVQGKMSVCGTNHGDVEVGPIWNNDDAKGKCSPLHNTAWRGQWTTVEQGKMSVCGCEPQS